MQERIWARKNRHQGTSYSLFDGHRDVLWNHVSRESLNLLHIERTATIHRKYLASHVRCIQRQICNC